MSATQNPPRGTPLTTAPGNRARGRQRAVSSQTPRGRPLLAGLAMRCAILVPAFFVIVAPAHAAASIPCSDLPMAERFVAKLKPGPNTRAAQQHLAIAKQATTERQCSKELGQVDKYARRSLAADKRAAAAHERHSGRSAQCADVFHENRPGGTDYHGPPVAGCP